MERWQVKFLENPNYRRTEKQIHYVMNHPPELKAGVDLNRSPILKVGRFWRNALGTWSLSPPALRCYQS